MPVSNIAWPMDGILWIDWPTDLGGSQMEPSETEKLREEWKHCVQEHAKAKTRAEAEKTFKQLEQAHKAWAASLPR